MFKIDSSYIGEGNKVFIIAEAGVNHNGDINLAKKMVDKAKEAGVDAVKFQTFKSEKLVTQTAKMAEYQKNNIGKEESQFEMLKKLELSFDGFAELKSYCEEKGILFLSTPFDIESAIFLDSIGIEAFKIGSGDLTNIPLLDKVAKFNKPMILSCGMSNMGEIEDAINVVKINGNNEIAMLHCTSNYPAPIESINLNAMKTIENAFKVIIGYSDHTEGITIPIAAAALGAKIIEKHFTLDKNMEGPDHKASLDPEELKSMVEAIRKVELAMGNGIKECTTSEANTKEVARKSIVAGRNIKSGEILKEEDLDFKRPGNGLSPKLYKELIGKKVIKDIYKDEAINFGIMDFGEKRR